MDNADRSAHIWIMQMQTVIIGGGLNGCTMALALAQAGLPVTLIEPKTSDTRGAPGFDGRGYALAHASKAMLATLGVWDGLQELSQPILEIKVTDGRAGEGPSPFVLEFSHTELEEGPMGWMVEDRHLRPALLTALSDHPLVTQVRGQVRDHHRDDMGVTVTLDDDEKIVATLLIAADGAGSLTAQRERIDRMKWGYDQTALVCAIAHEHPHDGIAHQFFMPGGPLAILPLPGNAASLVWTEATDEAARISALDDAGYLAELQPRVGDFLGDFRLSGDRYTYPLALSVAHEFVAPRVALIGDAAHRVHPIAGQGLNAGLRDIAALAETVILAARRGEDFGRIDVLKRYQSWRRFDVGALAMATDAFNRLFSNDNSALRLIRDLGLGAVNAVPDLRRALMREAAGLTGDLPRLLQGKKI